MKKKNAGNNGKSSSALNTSSGRLCVILLLIAPFSDISLANCHYLLAPANLRSLFSVHHFPFSIQRSHFHTAHPLRLPLPLPVALPFQLLRKFERDSSHIISLHMKTF
uniref:HDC13980 n=1 Tax=Drosophila melanogaster TaxID=7227 RepID=Q6IJY3_DROME|nr:TPA_inf: HDC13980 [Drosophila melanogaster]